jgi:nucleoid-associated protein YgaU
MKSGTFKKISASIILAGLCTQANANNNIANNNIANNNIANNNIANNNTANNNTANNNTANNNTANNSSEPNFANSESALENQNASNESSNGSENSNFANPELGNETPPSNQPMNNFGLQGNEAVFGNNSSARANNSASANATTAPTDLGSNAVVAPGLEASNSAPLNSPVAPASPDASNQSPANGTELPASEQPATAGAAATDKTTSAAAKLDGLTNEERELVRSRIEELKPRAPGSYPEEYIIQPGDTLWDISDQLLDDPFWWPKLWSYNPNILNPHLIEPGMRIVFAPSNGVLPPSLSLADSGEFLPVKINETTFKPEQSAKVEEWRDLDGTPISGNEVADFNLVDFYGNQTAESKAFVMLPAIMTTNPPEALAYIGKSAPQAITPAKGGILYSERNSSFRPNPGERFLAMRLQENPSLTSRDQAAPTSLWVYSGVLSTIAVEKTGRTRFLVEESLTGVRPDDRIVPFQNLFRPSDPSEYEPKSVPALVIAIGDGERIIAGYGDVIHLELEAGGVSIDDTIELHSPPGGLGGIDDDFEMVPAGEARIISVSEKWAAAVITRSDKEIIVGSRSGPL